MNLVAKLRIMLADIEALKARVSALESLPQPIVIDSSIASDKVPPPPKRRGRPPKLPEGSRGNRQ